MLFNDFKQVPAVNFSENFKLPGTGKLILFKGESITKWVNECLPQLSQIPVNDTIPVGDCLLTVQPWQPKELLPCYSELQDVYGFSTVDSQAFLPILSKANGEIWMSLTPNEIGTQRGGVRIANGNVLIAGMGLGWLARRVLQRRSVTQVTVVDINPDILNYFGKPLQEEFGDRLKLVCCDFYQYQEIRQHQIVLVDIWEKFGNAFYDFKFKEFKRKFHSKIKIWGWGDAKFRGFKDKAFLKMNTLEKLELANLVAGSENK